MRKNVFLLFVMTIMLTGCATDKQVAQSVLVSIPVAFLISFGFQYLFFSMWKRKWPEISMSWFPNFVFWIGLIAISIIFGNLHNISFGNTLSIISSSYLTVLLIVTRIWLFFNHSKVFTWASIFTMCFFISPTLPMIAGITQGTPFFYTYVFPLWVYPGGAQFTENFKYPGFLTALVFFILLLEVWLKTRKKVNSAHH